MASYGGAFFKGGAGCFGLFVVLAVIALAVGGSVRADGLGIVLLIVIGGVIGMGVNWIYRKGRRDAERGPDEWR